MSPDESQTQYENIFMDIFSVHENLFHVQPSYVDFHCAGHIINCNWLIVSRYKVTVLTLEDNIFQSEFPPFGKTDDERSYSAPREPLQYFVTVGASLKLSVE